MNYTTRDAFGPALSATKRQLGRFNLTELVLAAAADDQARLAYYREISDELQAKTGKIASTHRSFYLPAEYMARDLQASNSGGYLVATEHNFASELFNGALVGRLPLRALPLKGNLSMGTALTVDTAWQAGEGTQISHSDPTFGVMAMTPKTVATVVTLSRQLHLQLGNEGNQFIEQQLGRALAQAVDTALVNGSGASGQPLGLLGASGTTAVSGTTLAWSGIRDMLAAREGYAPGGLFFLAGITTAKLLRAREKATGSGMILSDGKIDGVPVIVSRSVPADALVLAPFDLVVMGTWSPIEVTISPYTSAANFQTGKIGVRLMWSIDFGVEHPAAVSKSVSIT